MGEPFDCIHCPDGVAFADLDAFIRHLKQTHPEVGSRVPDLPSLPAVGREEETE